MLESYALLLVLLVILALIGVASRDSWRDIEHARYRDRRDGRR